MPGPAGSGFSPPGGYGQGNTITVELANKASFLGRFKQYKAGIVLQADAIAEEITQRIAEAARDLVATDTEKTKDSIRTEKREHHVVVVDRFGDRPEVPIYLEIGTYKMAARPFLKPAADLVMASGGLLRISTTLGGLLGPMRGLGGL